MFSGGSPTLAAPDCHCTPVLHPLSARVERRWVMARADAPPGSFIGLAEGRSHRTSHRLCCRSSDEAPRPAEMGANLPVAAKPSASTRGFGNRWLPQEMQCLLYSVISLSHH